MAANTWQRPMCIWAGPIGPHVCHTHIYSPQKFIVPEQPHFRGDFSSSRVSPSRCLSSHFLNANHGENLLLTLLLLVPALVSSSESCFFFVFFWICRFSKTTSICSTLQLSSRRESTSSSVSCNLLTLSSWYFFFISLTPEINWMRYNKVWCSVYCFCCRTSSARDALTCESFTDSY